MAVMSDASDRLSERDEIEALLPWYVSGRLDANSRARVERYMKAHPEIREHLALAREESDATVTANEAIPAPGAQALDRLRAGIAAHPRRKSLGAILEQISERFADWIAGFAPPRLALVAAAAALVVMLQAAAIGALVLQRAGAPTYQTAGGEQTVVEGTELLVGFSEEATIGEITALLKQLDAVMVDGPKAGLYRLRLPEKGEEGAKAATEFLLQSGIVTTVLPEG
jgi:AcrR family transcriptional regulator